MTIYKPRDRVQCIDNKQAGRLKVGDEYTLKSVFDGPDGNTLFLVEPPPELARSWPEGMGPYSSRRFMPAEIPYDPTQMGDREEDI